MIKNHYSNDDLFDLNEKHFVLDARAAWVTDIKNLINHLVKLKTSICERLPKCTMFLNRTLFHLQNWRKDLQSRHEPQSNTNHSQVNTTNLSTHSTPNTKYPIISLKHFNDRIREFINPLASDEHLNELLQQLKLMGEIVFLEYSQMNESDHMICFQPEWLCGRILGNLYSYDRYFNVSPNNLNGMYTLKDLEIIYTNICTNTRLLKDIFIALDLCTEMNNEVTGVPMYEFPSLNFLSEPMPLAFQTVKNSIHNQKNQKDPILYVFNGFKLKTSFFHLNLKQNNSMTSSTRNSNLISGPVSQLASLFFRIQTNLRYLTKSLLMDDIDDSLFQNEHKLKDDSSSSSQNSHQRLLRVKSKLDTLFETPSTKYSMSSTPLSTQSPSSPLNKFRYLTNVIINQNQSKMYTQNGQTMSESVSSNRKSSNSNCMSGALIDFELYQTRYCSRLVRKTCQIECLVSLDHLNGEFIELRACAPENMREELFYFVQDLNSFIQKVINDSCSDGINIEVHYLDFKSKFVPDLTNKNASINLGVVSYDSILSPMDIVNLEFKSTKSNTISHDIETKLTNLICCGSDIITKNLSYGIDLPLSKFKNYISRMICIYLDKPDPMGLDWSILAVVLGLQHILPRIEEYKSTSRTLSVINEWILLKQDEATVRNFLIKINDLGRKDVHELIMNTVDLFQINISKDSGIQNSSQTLASLK